MSSKSRACVVAASVAVVEALKDQGICRWNYPIRCAYQCAKSRAGSLSQARMLPPSSSSSMGSSKVREEDRASQSEESLRKVMWSTIKIKSLHQHSKIHAGSMSQAKKLASQSSEAVSLTRDPEKVNQAEESLRKVMYLSCWDPN
ncbi:hypothetical protein SAY87_008154 [Trapa incisa]|uniref:Wound-responsive family protein n=1 Tax=Trapa incisa TaxID=236973 RepID=A0AAN7KHQ2_9MYRT|nr:hypothetical protein SAY87_008154 [Trapa incisa]